MLLVSRYGGAGGYLRYANCLLIGAGIEFDTHAIGLVSYLWRVTGAARCSPRRYTRWDEIGTQNWTRDTQNVNSEMPVPLLIQGQNVGIGVQPVCHSGTRDGMYPYANWPSDTPTLAGMYALVEWTSPDCSQDQNCPRITTWNWSMSQWTEWHMSGTRNWTRDTHMHMTPIHTDWHSI